MVICEKPQLFVNAPQTPIMFEPQPHCMDIISDWARSCPPSTSGILDLAAGYGVEVRALRNAGIAVVGQEGSAPMRDYAVTRLSNGLVEDLHIHPDGAFGGALLKDTLIFLKPNQRELMFEGVRRILVPRGSFLIISQLFDVNDAILDLSDDHRIMVYDEKEKREYKKRVTTRTISTPEAVAKLAQHYGFSYELIRSYDRDDPLARENHWIVHAGFIAKTIKLI